MRDLQHEGVLLGASHAHLGGAEVDIGIGAHAASTGALTCEYSPRTFNSYYCNVLKRSEIEHHTFHSLRHTFATRAVRMGMDAETLSRILGHASVTITLSRYYHPTTKDLINAIDKIYS